VNTVDARMLDGGVAAVLVEGWHPNKKQKLIATYFTDPPFFLSSNLMVQIQPIDSLYWRYAPAVTTSRFPPSVDLASERGSDDGRNDQRQNSDGHSASQTSSNVDRVALRAEPVGNPKPVVPFTVIEETTPPVDRILPLRFVDAILVRGFILAMAVHALRNARPSRAPCRP
jgi:hypothetical protein